jgi:hypothetical protein
MDLELQRRQLHNSFLIEEEKLRDSMLKMKDCFKKGKEVLEDDIKQMGKKMRKNRRKLKVQRAYSFTQKELELEDLLSSDESSDKVPGSVIDESNYKQNETARKFKMGLYGVILKDNGEPLELTASGKWDHKYDTTNSFVN